MATTEVRYLLRGVINDVRPAGVLYSGRLSQAVVRTFV